MKIDGGIGFSPAGVAEEAAKAEASGYDGVWSAETSHDPFLPIAIGAGATEKLEFGTGITVAFARNPMTLAVLANDLQLLTKGRFMMGMGSQIKPHITKRFSMPWSHPAPRMREMILAIRAIWKTWETGDKLDFRGEFYTHTLMTPFFNPGHSPYGVPRIFLGGVGPRMTEVAGEVADGFMVHPFTTEKFLRETSLPALERGLARNGRTLTDLELALPLMIVAGDTDEQLARGRDAMRPRLAFYGSTPAYKIVLDAHGWGGLQPELNRLSKLGDWATMSGMITDEIVDTFAIVGPAEKIGTLTRERWGDTLQRVSVDAHDPRVLEGFR
jgi:probable F420-dependent oxidoreductase